MKTYQPKHKDIRRNWHLMDAKGQTLGRFASEIARLLIGKHKVDYSAHMDMGDNVVVINAKDIEVTGKKSEQKVYYSHSGFPGGLKEIKYKKLLKEDPTRIIKMAVNGMLPVNRLRKKRMTRLKVFAGSEHKYEKALKNAAKKEKVNK